VEAAEALYRAMRNDPGIKLEGGHQVPGGLSGLVERTFGRLRIAARLWLMVAISAAMFLISVTIGWHGLDDSRIALKSLYEDSAVPMSALGNLRTISKENYAEVLRAFQHDPNGNLLSFHDHELSMHFDAIKSRKDENDRLWAEVTDRNLTEAEQKLVAEIKEKRLAWQSKRDAALAAMKAGDFSAEVMAAYLKAGREEGAVFDASLDQLSELAKTSAKTHYEIAERAYQRDVKIFIALTILGLLTVLGIAWFTLNRITRSLREAGEFAETIASGDLTKPMPRASEDEIGDLMAKLGVMRNTLHEVIASISQNMKGLNQSAGELASSAASSAQTTEMQAESASSMAASVEQLSVSIDQVEEHAREARNITQASSLQSTEGGRIIHDAAAEMRHIADAVKSTASTIKELEGYSDQISSIVQVIKDIADRAGEQGRGFAVVADEVRKLAERTGNSTQEISSMIGKIQQGTQRAVQEMETGVKRVGEGVDLAHKAGDSVTGIRDSAEQTTRAVDDINLALKEQAVAARDIAQKVERIAQGSEQNSAAVAQTAASAHRLEMLARELAALAARFRIA
jgi:methyl-accepting chemotaxis protein